MIISPGTLNNLKDDLPKIITRLKDEYEVILGLDYPFEQLALIEVPLHFFSPGRQWTSVNEAVQPQLVFLPEMGTLCSGADLAAVSRWFRRSRGTGKGGGKDMTSSDIQANLFSSFIQTNFLGTEPSKESGGRDVVSGLMESDRETDFKLMPNYFTSRPRLASSRWPVLHSALESWLQDRISASTFRFDRGMGLTEQERTNMLLDGRSLSEILEDHTLTDVELEHVILAKGKYLMSVIESRIQEDGFDNKLLSFIEENRFRTIKEEEFLQFLFEYEDFDLEPVMAAWYQVTDFPPFTSVPSK